MYNQFNIMIYSIINKHRAYIGFYQINKRNNDRYLLSRLSLMAPMFYNKSFQNLLKYMYS